ncbi:unnamed protein product, partial [Ixodes pacificus]
MPSSCVGDMRQKVRASGTPLPEPPGGDGVPVLGGDRSLSQLDAPELELVQERVPEGTARGTTPPSDGTLGDFGLHDRRIRTMAAMQSSMVSASSVALGRRLRPL